MLRPISDAAVSMQILGVEVASWPITSHSALQRYFRYWGLKPTFRANCCVWQQPRHASLIGGVRRSSSGSLAKFAAMRRASSRVSRLVAERRPGSSSK
jgi:hypothetical protein